MKYMYMSFCLLPFLESLIGPCIGLQFFNQFDNQSNWDRLDSSGESFGELPSNIIYL